MGAIYLVRHGQASFGAADYDLLSPNGFSQSTVAGAELARREAVFSQARVGSMARQRDTASTVLKGLGSALVAKEDPRWNEYDHVDIATHHAGGAEQGEDSRAYQAALDGALTAWIAAGSGGPCAETWPAFRDRVRGALEDLAGELGKGRNAVVFTSGGVIATLCGILLGIPEIGLVKLNRVTVNGGITKLVSGRGGLTLLSFNEHGHFEGENSSLLTYR
jgi:broad specificity phosphatase PhoE